MLIARGKESAAGKLHPGDLAKRGRGLLAFLRDANKKREPELDRVALALISSLRRQLEQPQLVPAHRILFVPGPLH